MRLVAAFDFWEHAYLPDLAPAARRDNIAVPFDNLDWSVIKARCH